MILKRCRNEGLYLGFLLEVSAMQSVAYLVSKDFYKNLCEL